MDKGILFMAILVGIVVVGLAVAFTVAEICSKIYDKKKGK